MKLAIALFALCSIANSQIIKQTLGTNALTVTTNANLTGPVTSVGNATTVVGPVPVAAIDLSTVAAKGTNSDITSMSTLASVSAALTTTSSVTVTGAGGLGVTYGISAATGSFTGTGANYSLTTSSGISDQPAFEDVTVDGEFRDNQRECQHRDDSRDDKREAPRLYGRFRRHGPCQRRRDCRGRLGEHRHEHPNP